MATMTWDNELAKLAVSNVKQCVMKHDSCHKTVLFPKAGQNLNSGKFFNTDVKTLAMDYIQMWFDEYKLTDMRVINKFQDLGNV